MRPLVSNQVDPEEVRLITQLLEKAITNNIEGDVVELGCYVGTTSLFLQETLMSKAPYKRLYVYDSFSGLPEKTHKDQSPAGLQFVPGELATSKKVLIQHFKQAGLPLPKITKAWFSDLRATDMPPTTCFAFLDGDYYESITDSLKIVWNTMPRGSIIVVDDYINEALPGAKKAIDEWLATHTYQHMQSRASLAIIEK